MEAGGASTTTTRKRKAAALEGHPAPAPVAAAFSPAELELSWVVVDPARGRAVNVSSRRAVAVDRHWYTGETLVRYAVVLGGSKFEATVTCSEEAGCLNLIREVSLTVEDADGAAVSGEGSLRLLAAAMEGPRRKGGERERYEAKRMYEEFVRSKRGRKESKARREVLVDLCCSAVSAVAVTVLSFLASVALRQSKGPDVCTTVPRGTCTAVPLEQRSQKSTEI